MAQLEDLLAKEKAVNDGLDAIGTALTQDATDQAKTLADLKALILANIPTPPPDLQAALDASDAQLAKTQAIAAAVTQLDTDVLAADVTVPTVTTPVVPQS